MSQYGQKKAEVWGTEAKLRAYWHQVGRSETTALLYRRSGGIFKTFQNIFNNKYRESYTLLEYSDGRVLVEKWHNYG